MWRIPIITLVISVIAWLCLSPLSAQLKLTHELTLSMHFSKDMGGGGDLRAKLSFTSDSLCRSVRRAIWSALKDAEGDIGDCIQIR